MKVTIRQLQVFDAVAATGSVTAAGNRLNMSQSAASAALTDLQVILGRQLFAHARGRPLQITDEGKRLRPIIRSVLGEIEDIEGSQDGRPLNGQLVLGATPMVAETILPQLCVKFMQEHPEVQIRVETESTMDLFGRLGRFELETAVIENFPDVPGIDLTPWRTDEMILIVAPDHDLAQRRRLTVRDLAGEQWCLREAASSESARLRYILHEQIGQIRVAFETTSNWGIRQAVMAGGGIGCLSREIVKDDLQSGGLIQLAVSGFSYTRALSLARPKSITRGRLVTTFDRFLIENA
ncbi:LysR substrate-binding domain-containing protein [Novosphingobium resinovorum]|uniref:LysR substrate-binding domain-containing protein n=1 Tax=Novosphingobium resinovorum TaxID=158500 RepID=UPI002ED04962|nr:LysR substrate-binding domain-containing protein [Novosphingobium resinovorum]